MVLVCINGTGMHKWYWYASRQREVFHSYNKNQGDVIFLNFILVKTQYMFQIDLLSIIRSLKLLVPELFFLILAHPVYKM